jgi:hypothetical protein
LIHFFQDSIVEVVTATGVFWSLNFSGSGLLATNTPGFPHCTHPFFCVVAIVVASICSVVSPIKLPHPEADKKSPPNNCSYQQPRASSPLEERLEIGDDK